MAVQFRFRRWRRSSKSFGLRLDNKLMRKVNLKNAEISEDVNEDGFYTVCQWVVGVVYVVLCDLLYIS